MLRGKSPDEEGDSFLVFSSRAPPKKKTCALSLRKERPKKKENDTIRAIGPGWGR